MRERLSSARGALAAILLASLVSSLGAPARAGGKAPGALADCANPNLPKSILAGPYASSSRPLPTVSIPGGRTPLDLAVASDEGSRELGLMCVTRLLPAHGMIFVFTAPAIQEFWMKNTLIPLDMIWVDGEGTVTSVAAHVPASTRQTANDDVARRRGTGTYVIELGDGQASACGIAAGTKLSLPHLRATE
jgi:uncharacterized membrane protein (UPF0127 family)